MWNIIEKVSIVGGGLGVLALALSMGWYVFDLEWRVRSLEAQALTQSSSTIQSVQGSNTGLTMSEACAQVSKHLSEAIQPVGFGTVVEAYKEQLKLLGCDKR